MGGSLSKFVLEKHVGRWATLAPWIQGRREKFRAPMQKFRLGPLVSGAPKSCDEQKKVMS